MTGSLVFLLAMAAAVCGIPNENVNPRLMLDTLQDDLHDFADLVPTIQIIDLGFQCLGDQEFQNGLHNLFGPEFRDILKDMEQLEVSRALFQFLNEQSIPIYDILYAADNLLGSSPMIPQLASDFQCGGLEGFMEKSIELLPRDQFHKLAVSKQSNPAFRELLAAFNSDKLADINRNIINNADFQMLRDRIVKLGIPADKIVQFFLVTMGLDM